MLQWRHSLLSYRGEVGRRWESPGLPRPAASADSEETQKRREPGSQDFPRSPALAGWPASRSWCRAWALAAPGASRQELLPASWVCRDCRENPPNILKVVSFHPVLIFFFSLLGALRQCTGWVKWGGLGSGSFRLFSSLTARK